MEYWKRLIEKHVPSNARVCNCGNAYEYRCGHGIVCGVEKHDLWDCPNGCSFNQIMAKEYIASKILE